MQWSTPLQRQFQRQVQRHGSYISTALKLKATRLLCQTPDFKPQVLHTFTQAMRIEAAGTRKDASVTLLVLSCSSELTRLDVAVHNALQAQQRLHR